MQILVAEDEPGSRHRLQALLRRWGYSVRMVAEALYRAKRAGRDRVELEVMGVC